MIRILIVALALAGCASNAAPHKSIAKHDSRVAQERGEEAVRRMQDEFNQATGDAN